jgi:HD-GYP domain-containing protein (c-di-GMP phosphodiesterase class II)/putative methionine-R-sulfoxide reductase with GAF domain
MLYGGELIGVLAVSVLGPVERRFTEEEMHLLYLFAGQAAGAIYNTRLFTEIRRANRELERLYHATGTLIASISLDLATLAQTIVSIVVSDFQHANCALWLLDDETKELKRLALAGSFSGQMRLNKLYLHGSGIIPRTVRTGQISNGPNVLEDRDYKVGWLEARSELCVPLEVNGRVIGALDLQSAKPAAFDSSDERLMFMFASRAGLMLEHARLLEQTERRLQRLTALRAIEMAIASSLELSVTLNVLLEQITAQLKVDAAAILLLDSHLQTLEYAAGRGFLGHGIERAYLRIGEDYAGRAVLERTLIGVADLNEPGAAPERPERIAGERFVTYYAVPLLAKGQVKGVLELYYRKRFDADAEWPDFLETLGRQAAVAIDDASMFTQLQSSYTDLIVAYDTSIEVWSRALDLREKEPSGHAQRLTDLSLRLAREMGVDESLLPHIYRGALLHDIGQLSIPDSILLKPGPLTEEEWEIMREHPRRAYEMLFPVVYLHPALNIPYCHHERWDGSGYPRGLKGEEIPIEARIFAVVDTWDALCTNRPQRPAWSEKDALRYIREQAGKQFDPAVVEAFLRVIEGFRQA